MEVLFIGKPRQVFQKFDLHEHGYWELLYNYSGTGLFHTGEEQIPFTTGSMFVIPPGVRHAKTSEEGFEDYCIFIRDMRPIGDSSPKLILDDEEKTLFGITETMYRIWSSPGSVPQDRVQPVLNACADALYQLLAAYYAAGRTGNIDLEPFLQRMEKNWMNPSFNLGEQIDAYGYSRGYFRRAFKDLTGETPVAYFNRLKIEHARDMLLDFGRSRTVREVALSCGFDDPYYFSRLFKKITGLSPTALVEQIGVFDPEQMDGDHLL